MTNWINRITLNTEQCGGRPCIRGMRIRVTDVLDLLALSLIHISQMGAGWCPPGILGVGIGGTPEKAFMLAKESLLSLIHISCASALM